MSVTFLDAGERGSAFWAACAGTVSAAAEDLGVRLTLLPVPHWPGERLARLKRHLEGPERPDYLILTIHKGIRAAELEMAEAAGVRTFVVNAGLLPADSLRLGGPRERLHTWIGQMLPDEEEAGAQLARQLLAAARAGGPHRQGAIAVAGLGGRESDLPAQQRKAGLLRVLSEDPMTDLTQVVPAHYDATVAAEKAPRLLRRYPRLSVLWAANDRMALGAVRALQAQGRRPGRDVFVGGIDWDPEALEAVRRGELVTTLGGHFLDPAWALVLLYDYHHGRDFAGEQVDWRTRLLPATRANLDAVTRLVGDRDWSRFDFRAFSKVCTPSLQKYAFSVEALLAQSRRGTGGRP